MVGPPPEELVPGTPEAEDAARHRREVAERAERLGCSFAESALLAGLLYTRDHADGDLRHTLERNLASWRGFQDDVCRGQVDTTQDEQHDVAARIHWIEVLLREDGALEAFAADDHEFLTDFLRRHPHTEWTPPDPTILDYL
jgi:hypothetical protein